MILPFPEFKEDEIDVECYKCEFVVFSNESLHDSYIVGLENIGEFIKSKENKLMMRNILIEDDKKNKSK